MAELKKITGETAKIMLGFGVFGVAALGVPALAHRQRDQWNAILEGVAVFGHLQHTADHQGQA